MDTPGLPGSYSESTDQDPLHPLADRGRRRFSSSPSIEFLSSADRLHLEVYFESRPNSGYWGQLAAFLLGIVGFMLSASAVVLKMIDPVVSEPVDSAQITEYFRARSAERLPTPPPLPPPELSPSSDSLDSLPPSTPSDTIDRPLVTRHVTFHVNAGDLDAQAFGSSDTFPELQADGPRTPETTSPLRPKRRLFHRSATVAGAPSVPAEDEDSTPADTNASAGPSRPPHVFRRSMKGIKEAIRRKPRPISTSPPHSPMVIDDDDGRGVFVSPRTRIDDINFPHPPSSHPPLQLDGNLNSTDQLSKPPLLSRAPSAKRSTCPSKKSLAMKPPPLRTAYTYTFVSVKTPKSEEEDVSEPFSSPSIIRPGYPRGRTTYDGRRVASDPVPIPVFTPLAPSATSPSSAVLAARLQACRALEGTQPPRERHMSTPPKTSTEAFGAVGGKRSSRSSLPPPERPQDPIVPLGSHRRSLSEKRHSTQ